MPSQAMQDVIASLRDRQQASASQAPPTLEQRRAAFVPGDRLHPVPDDVVAADVTAGGVPAHWLAAPGTDPGRVLLFLHGGGYELGLVRSDGESPPVGGPAGCGCCSPNTGWPPSILFPPPSTACWPHGAGCAPAGPERTINRGGRRFGGRGLAVALLVATRNAGQALPAAAVLMSPTVN